MVFQEIIAFKAQVRVDVYAVIEPVIARMAAGDRIALAGKIADIGIGRAAERAEVAVAGQETAFGVNRAAGKNIGEQVPGDPFRLQLVVFFIGVCVELDLVIHRKSA